MEAFAVSYGRFRIARKNLAHAVAIHHKQAVVSFQARRILDLSDAGQRKAHDSLILLPSDFVFGFARSGLRLRPEKASAGGNTDARASKYAAAAALSTPIIAMRGCSGARRRLSSPIRF
jgi:hypothetical protein